MPYPIRTVTYATNPASADALSVTAGLAAGQAITLIAKAAACEERLDDGSNNEGQLWFLVRALCNEHGHDYDEMVRMARNFANLL